MCYFCHVDNGKTTKLNKMKTFTLTIFKGQEMMQAKTVTVFSREELQLQKNAFWQESPYKKENPKNWMGVKRIR